MHCKSLWIKASAKCINVNVNVILINVENGCAEIYIYIYIYFKKKFLGFFHEYEVKKKKSALI